MLLQALQDALNSITGFHYRSTQEQAFQQFPPNSLLWDQIRTHNISETDEH